MADLDYLTVGQVYDILIEKGNDQFDYDEIATAEDIANF